MNRKTRKIDENRKITLTIGQLKRLVKESLLPDEEQNTTEKDCKWVAWSNDGSFEDESDKTFYYANDAYADMAQQAVNKMLWNTEYSDFNDCESIGYGVVFTPEAIAHDSYSGLYVWAIIDEDQTLTSEQKKKIENRLMKLIRG